MPNLDPATVFALVTAASTAAFLAWTAKQAGREWLLWPLLALSLYCLYLAAPILMSRRGTEAFQTLVVVFAALGIPSGVYVGFLTYRTLTHGKEALDAQLNQATSAAIDGPTDIRTVASLLPAAGEDADPRSHFKPGEFVMGQSDTGEPVRWEGSLPHVLVLGTTGAGKGVFLQTIAAQAVQNGELLVLIDPKNDEWLPHSLFQACQQLGATYRYLQLAGEAGPQIDLVAGATAEQVFEIFIGAMALSDTGKGADYYRLFDRRGARFAAQLIAAEKLNLAEAYEKLKADAFFQDDASGFLGKLEELSQVVAINAKVPAWGLAEMVETGGAVYVLGSLRNQSVKRGQQAVFIRLQQLAEQRDRLGGPHKTITVIADEFKVQVCRPIVEGLATMRDKNMRLVIAMQSLKDLLESPKDLDPEAVMASVVENTAAQIVYRIQDPATAELLAQKSGSVRVQQVSRRVARGLLWTEEIDGKTLSDAEGYLFDMNKLMSMPKRWAVMYGQGVAQAIRISPIPVQKSRDALVPSLAADPDASMPPQSVPTPKPKSSRTKQRGPEDTDFFALE